LYRKAIKEDTPPNISLKKYNFSFFVKNREMGMINTTAH
jgi:hypothetical protein